ncbi:dihydroorotase [uncultured Polaribacter sp.]|uniref:dihydroorotase n=1 Tax=uncultured Polaribacter sp. TaxID=174711 RepID=UPI0026019B90|nr:dihydroorotase [uncultured Polaribacter sp.]
MNILLKSATIFDKKSPYHKKTQDILIKESTFVQIADHIDCPEDVQEIQLDNLHVSNGWFDTSVSFGEPGYEERETIANGLDVAAKAGFTDVAMNSNTNPYIDTKSSVVFIKNESHSKATNLHPIASLTQASKGEEIAELYDMKQVGAIAFGDYNKALSNDNLMKVALLYAQNFDGLVLSFPNNKVIAGEGIANEGENSTLLGLKGIPNLAEELQIARDIAILEYTGGKLHIPTISTSKSVDLIRQAKQKGLQVSCSVTAHHLCLTDSELKSFDGNVKVLPPLRTEQDRLALIEGVNDGTIDIITSDHNPIDIENKKVEFSNAKYGTIGLESLFGSLLTVLDTETIIDCLTHKPKEIFEIENLSIDTGNKVSISLFNTTDKNIFQESDILSTSKNAVFLHKELKGKAYGVFANNQLILK